MTLRLDSPLLPVCPFFPLLPMDCTARFFPFKADVLSPDRKSNCSCLRLVQGLALLEESPAPAAPEGQAGPEGRCRRRPAQHHHAPARARAGQRALSLGAGRGGGAGEASVGAGLLGALLRGAAFLRALPGPRPRRAGATAAGSWRVPAQLTAQLLQAPGLGLVDPLELDVLGLGDGAVVQHDPVEGGLHLVGGRGGPGLRLGGRRHVQIHVGAVRGAAGA